MKYEDCEIYINLAASDIRYAAVTVPHMLRVHRSRCSLITIIADRCRPQRTKLRNHLLEVPEDVWQEKLSLLEKLVDKFVEAKLVDRVIWMEPESEELREISSRYFQGIITPSDTHDYGGIGLMSYALGMLKSNAKYLVHYDADMALHTSPETDWVVQGLKLMHRRQDILAVSPRTEPPLDLTDPLQGLYQYCDVESDPEGVRLKWFSTRAFLLDRERLESEFVPLLKGKILRETLLVKYLKRGFPRSWEGMIFWRCMKQGGLWRLNLKEPKEWVSHPSRKQEIYYQMFNKIYESIAVSNWPIEQNGKSDFELEAWQKFLT